MVMIKFINKFEFIALDKCREEVERLYPFLNDISRWSKCVFQYIVIVNLLLVENKTV